MFLSNILSYYIYKLFIILARILNLLIMNRLIKINIFFFFLFTFFSTSAQKGYYEQELEMPFQPRFSLGSGYYSAQADIKGPKTNNLLGNIGFKAGMRFNVAKNTDISLLFSDFKLSETSENKFSSEVNSVGLHLNYTFNNLFKNNNISPFINLGVEQVNYKTVTWENYDVKNQFAGKTIHPKESSFMVPVGLGLALNVSERIRFDVSFNYITSLADFDLQEPSSVDNIILADFVIHYDFFTLVPKKPKTDDSFYSDVNFKAFEVEDEDGDLVPDVNDRCLKTPQGVEVDVYGCPLDDDKDGIANYLDKELNTLEGALVDEFGVTLTDEKYRSMYDYEVASRKYANVYNNSEIQKDDYQNINDYLIAKANAFNKKYNNELEDSNKGLRYKIQIAKYDEDISENEQIRLLSIDDLESVAQDDGYIIYMVGNYKSIDDAQNRLYKLEAEGFNDVYLLEDIDGYIKEYVEELEMPIDNNQKMDSSDDKDEIKDEKKNINEVEETLNVNTDKTIYRVQIGAYEVKLSDEIFNGIDNVIHMKDSDGLIKYMTGSFVDKKPAVDYMFQMRARGFEDAFVVSYKNGKRSIEYFVQKKQEKSRKAKSSPKASNNKALLNNASKEKIKVNIQYTVQIFVGKASLSAENLEKMSKVGNVTSEQSGTEMYKYYAGKYQDFSEATARVLEVQKAGFKEAFIFATKDGERITIEEARNLQNN
ncbi:MAG: hypothetical protein CMD06_06290 [Flavobacteriales bacterium]|nr:hypothetical protein [Flavobacteriales bacterium]